MPEHGTYAGAVAHWDDGEPACDLCRVAATRYRKGLRWEHHNGRRRTVPAGGTVRRIQALQRLGWSVPVLARRLGMAAGVIYGLQDNALGVRRETAEKVATLYEDLAMTLPPQTTVGERISARRASSHAARQGWLPPLAWEDIDAGIAAVVSTRTTWRQADLADEWDHLRWAGLTIDQAAGRLGLTVDAIQAAVRRAS